MSLLPCVPLCSPFAKAFLQPPFPKEGGSMPASPGPSPAAILPLCSFCPHSPPPGGPPCPAPSCLHCRSLPGAAFGDPDAAGPRSPSCGLRSGGPQGHWSPKAIRPTPCLPDVFFLGPLKPWAPGETAKSQVWEGFLEEKARKEKRNGGRPGQGEKGHIWRTDAPASGSWQLVR